MESIFNVMIVAIVFSAIFGRGIVKMVLQHRKDVRTLELSERNTLGEQEREQLQQQIEALKTRVEVLERIVTDRKYQLENEIASL
ncbi:nitrite reductase [Vibrio sp. CAU 1672]|uniref:nitrite reductase n=1 Tax=Vibrio sp. CAU 1672 TaxID=3032594 RepID=UPI0023D9E4AB|nr:nitrite reductase [Vibrio sp. CAU 1672]MDF2153431.1 nitrite reductase [Vibrio sp. CAU 1672]